MAAAVLIWATDLSQTAAQVKEVLVSTGDKIPYPGLKLKNRPTAFNLKRAIERVRQNIIKRALANGPLEIQELIVASGLGPRVTVQVLEKMEEMNPKPIRRFMSTKGESYELVTADSRAPKQT
jgi:methylthioribose-1-phosphate isomerase